MVREVLRTAYSSAGCPTAGVDEAADATAVAESAALAGRSEFTAEQLRRLVLTSLRRGLEPATVEGGAALTSAPALDALASADSAAADGASGNAGHGSADVLQALVQRPESEHGGRGGSFDGIVRMVNWKVGLLRPSLAEALEVIAGSGPERCAAVCVAEMEVPLDAECSAASLACEHGAPFELLVEHVEDAKKYRIYLSVLVPQGSEAAVVGPLQAVTRSSKRSHKVVLAQDVRLGPPGAPVVQLMGVNLDPQEAQFDLMLAGLEQHVADLTGVDALLAAGDFNVRIPCPSWLACEDAGATAGGGLCILDDDATSTLAALLADPAGRRQLAQLDPLAEQGTAVVQAQRLARLMEFDSLAEQFDPGYPTYKRTPGIVPCDDADVLREAYFGMPATEGDPCASWPQREVRRRLGPELQWLQLGWLDRGAWLVPASTPCRPPGRKLDVQIVYHEGLPSPALSDHAATVTEFHLRRSAADG